MTTPSDDKDPRTADLSEIPASAFPYSQDVTGMALPDGTPLPAGKKWTLTDRGMTLRDYFAAQAMAALCTPQLIAGATSAGRAGEEIASVVSEAAYQLADAMLAKREEKKS